jgi:UDP-N-acetyl-D-galactosamine dehydrogenase
MGIDTKEVLEAAGTKWNFLKFSPGLVGGHCIGVDPYYLAQKAQEIGYHPEIILAGRRVNDGMGAYVANEVVKLMIKCNTLIKNSKVLILGFTFKENCPDIRNTKVIDIFNELLKYEIEVTILDPWARQDEVLHEYGISIINDFPNDNIKYNGIILAVAHENFSNMDLEKFKSNQTIIYDVKGLLPKNSINARL